MGSLYPKTMNRRTFLKGMSAGAAGLTLSSAFFLPTVAELVEVKSPANIDGTSIVPTLLGGEQDLGDRFLYWEHFGSGFQQAVRLGDWKAVRTGLNQPLELYDLATDLGEEHNMADQHPDVAQSIEDYLKTARTASEYWPVP